MAKLVWRKDMPELLLSMLKARVEDKLAWWFKWRGRLVPIASPSAADTVHVDDVACVLFHGSLRTAAHDTQDEANAIVAAADKWWDYVDKGLSGKKSNPQVMVPRLAPRALFPPLEYPTAAWRGRKVALYSLTDMLGSERAEALVNGTRYEGERCWVMKRGRQAVEVQMLLGQLQGYLAEPGVVWWPK